MRLQMKPRPCKQCLRKLVKYFSSNQIASYLALNIQEKKYRYDEQLADLWHRKEKKLRKKKTKLLTYLVISYQLTARNFFLSSFNCSERN